MLALPTSSVAVNCVSWLFVWMHNTRVDVYVQYVVVPLTVTIRLLCLLLRVSASLVHHDFRFICKCSRRLLMAPVQVPALLSVVLTGNRSQAN